MSPTNTAFSAISFISFILVCIPFPWHLEAWNTGTCLYMGWTALALLNYFINSIIWRDNAINWAPVWCDISSRVTVALAIAIPAASLCINRRLYYISSVRSVTRTQGEKIRGIVIDLSIGLGLPILAIPLQYIVEGHRFNIYEEIGCFPATYNTWPAYILVHTPPLLVSLISGGFAIMSIMAFRKRQTEFKEILSSNSNLTSSRYLRLMALAGLEVLFGVPTNLAVIILNAKEGNVRPWISWEDTHWGFSRVDQFPSLLWKANPVTRHSMEMTRWLPVACALVFFIFFGFADEAQRHYKLALSSITKKVGISTTGSTTKFGSISASIGFGKSSKNASTLEKSQGPIYVSQETIEKRDSMDTLSDLTSIRDVSEVGSDIGSPTSPYATLRRPSNPTVLLQPPVHGSSFPSQESKGRPISQSFPSSVTPTASFLDLAATHGDIKSGNDNRV
ncbi:pheromone A receptor-domain-containing protein [Crepidotus variabilis]|uniref:Pheromone A receptor-domain-containing protein n=1 Tax=Crepidotus variabilis TaxID=179855 RepID=A0A9P6JQK0_9AGAR|nr:pheromone A receptor-domain-containing protein [Crepidotus variabilis]